MKKRFGSSNIKQQTRISPKGIKNLSSFKREMIENDIDAGNLVEGKSYNSSTLIKNATNKNFDSSKGLNRGVWVSPEQQKNSNQHHNFAKAAIAFSPSYKESTLTRQAGMSSMGGGNGGSAGYSVDRLAPEVYSPLFTMANLNLPRDRITVNAWCRNFFDLHPIVRNAITLHATYPISKFNIKCSDKKVEDFFNAMSEEIDLLGVLGNVALEYWKLGEAFPYAELDESSGKWNRIIVQNSDYIHVKKTIVASEPVISLRPDAVLQRLVLSNSPADVQLRKQIPEEILFHVRKGNNIPLDNFNVSHLKMLSSPYDVRGTSIIISAFKDLMLYDKLREAKFAQADSLVNPITLVKVGGSSEGEYRPTEEDLQYWKNIIEEAQYDKDFKIITHAGMSIERIGASGAVLDISSDIELIIKNIFWGLMVPQSIVDSESAAYSSASIGLEVLRQRYFNFRNMLARWITNKIFAPISEINGFYEYKNGQKLLIVPEVEWNHMNLYDLQDYVSNISNLVGTNQASVHTLYRSLGLNYKDENKLIRQEAIDKAIAQREQTVLAGMSLQQLRSLDLDQDILEPLPDEEQNSPGVSGGPGDMGTGMGGDMGLGGLGGASGDFGGGMPELGPPAPNMEMGGTSAPLSGGVTPPLGPGTGV